MPLKRLTLPSGLPLNTAVRRYPSLCSNFGPSFSSPSQRGGSKAGSQMGPHLAYANREFNAMSCRRPSARTAAQDSRGNVMLQVAEEEELQVEAGSFCSAFLQEFIMAP